MLMNPPNIQKRFLEIEQVNEEKLYMPVDSVLTYEEVPKGKNSNFPTAKSFLRYDFGTGVSFSLALDNINKLEEEIGIDEFVKLVQTDDSILYIKRYLIVAFMGIKDHEEGANTQICITLEGQQVPMFVKDNYETVKEQTNGNL